MVGTMAVCLTRLRGGRHHGAGSTRRDRGSGVPGRRCRPARHGQGHRHRHEHGHVPLGSSKSSPGLSPSPGSRRGNKRAPTTPPSICRQARASSLGPLPCRLRRLLVCLPALHNVLVVFLLLLLCLTLCYPDIVFSLRASSHPTIPERTLRHHHPAHAPSSDRRLAHAAAHTTLTPTCILSFCVSRDRDLLRAQRTFLSQHRKRTLGHISMYVSYLGQVILPILALVARNSLEQRPVANETTRVLRGLYDNTSSACSRYIPRTAGMPTIALPWGNHARPEIADSRRHPALRICPCKRLASGGRLPHPKGAEHVSLEDHSLARATTNAAHMHSRAELS